MDKFAARLVRALPALALVVLATPASAQIVSAGYRPSSKTEAILGGAPSALAAITAQQEGTSLVRPAAMRPRVDLPDATRPMMAIRSPGSILRLIPLRLSTLAAG